MKDNFKVETTLYSKIKRSDDDEQLIKLVNDYGMNKKLKSGSPLYYACTYNKKRLVKYLLDNNVDVDALFDNNYTSLMSAVDEKNIEVVEMLLTAGANIKIQDKHGNNAFSKSIFSENLKLIGLFLEHGADPFEDYGEGTVYKDAVDMGLTSVVSFFDSTK